jgi:hypothetical protein
MEKAETAVEELTFVLLYMTRMRRSTEDTAAGRDTTSRHLTDWRRKD